VKDVHLEVLLPADKYLAARAAWLLGLERFKAAEEGVSQEEEDHEVDTRNNSIDRSFVFPGELATFFICVYKRQESTCKDVIELVEMSRKLEFVISLNDDACQPSAVLLCPSQPFSEEKHAIGIDARLKCAMGVYHFQIDFPTTGINNSGAVSNGGLVELGIYCRHKSAGYLSRVSKISREVSLQTMKFSDPLRYVDVLPEAQEIMLNNELKTSITSQTVELKKKINRVKSVAIQSRYRQLNSKCFIEVSCENIHPNFDVVLRDLTLHTFTSRPISMRVTRLGRWELPLRLMPGECQTVCFVLSGFQDVSSTSYMEKSEEDEGIGSRYTSIATVTWTSEITPSEVRGKHRVEWDFRSGVFDPIALRLERDEEGDDIVGRKRKERRGLRPGDKFKLLLVIVNRCKRNTDLRVILPTPKDLTSQSILPLDASVYVGSVLNRAVQVPLHFLALQPATVDVAELVRVYDANTQEVIVVKEPHYVSVS